MATSAYNILLTKVQATLRLETKKEAGATLDAVLFCLETTLLENLNTDKFALKLGRFGKFKVHHRAGHKRKVPFTGKTQFIPTKRKVLFTALGKLRELESVL